MKDAIKIALRKKDVNLKSHRTNCVFAANLTSAENYNNMFSNLNLQDGIYCGGYQDKAFPVKIDFKTNIVLPLIKKSK